MKSKVHATFDRPDSTAQGAVDFAVIESIYNTTHRPVVFLPGNGEVAREEHVREPFEYLKALDDYLNTTMGEQYAQALQLFSILKTSIETVNTQLNTIQSAINTWQINARVQLDNRLEVVERFVQPITLEPDSVEDHDLNVDHVSAGQLQLATNDTVVDSSKAAEAINDGQTIQVRTVGASTQEQDVRNLDGFLKQFEADNNLIRLPQQNAIQLDVPKIDNPQQIILSGHIDFVLAEPTRISYLELNLSTDVIDTITLYDEQGRVVQKVRGANVLYFSPVRVRQISVQLSDSVTVRKLPMNLTAYIVVVTNSDSSSTYVYYR